MRQQEAWRGFSPDRDKRKQEAVRAQPEQGQGNMAWRGEALSGNEKIALDLNYYAWASHQGTLTLIGTWLLSDEKKQPCMVIIRRDEETNPYTVPCIIPLERAWIWDEKTGDAGQRTFAAFEFCERLRIEPTQRNLVKLMIAVNHRLEDLIKMPPFPRGAFVDDGEVIGEGVIINRDTGQAREFELRDTNV